MPVLPGMYMNFHMECDRDLRNLNAKLDGHDSGFVHRG
jgi:hypothetical protein